MTVSRRTFMAAGAASALTLKASSKASSGRNPVVLKIPQGGVQPQAVVDAAGAIHVVYLYGDPAAADVAYVRKSPEAREFSAPLRVNDRAGSAIALGTVRGAHLALGSAGRVHVAWNGSSQAAPKGPHNSAPMLYSRLNDSGTAFEPQRSVMQIASGLDGGGTLAADTFGNVYVTWHAQGQPDGQPVVGENHRRVWMARSTDQGKTFSREIAISPEQTGACGCCGMGALADAKGNLYLLYRSARENVHRDMYLLTSTDRGKTFRAVDLQAWEIGACPMSTVSLTEAAGRVFVSWQTGPQVYFAAVDGQPVPAPGTGQNRKHSSLAVNDRGETFLVWTEGTGWKKGGSLKGYVFAKSGPFPIDLGPVPAWDFAAAVASRDRFYVIC